MEGFSLPKSNEQEKAVRDKAIQDATKYAIEIPFKVMQMAHGSLEVIKAMAAIGNPNSVTDAGVAALCARTAVLGAFMNVKINASGYKDKTYTDDIISQGQELELKTIVLEAEIIELVNSKI
jgi:glutamate formiminotransferase/formiminotetrahydrofolate cyclodeaminase